MLRKRDTRWSSWYTECASSKELDLDSLHPINPRNQSPQHAQQREAYWEQIHSLYNYTPGCSQAAHQQCLEMASLTRSHCTQELSSMLQHTPAQRTSLKDVLNKSQSTHLCCLRNRDGLLREYTACANTVSCCTNLLATHWYNQYIQSEGYMPRECTISQHRSKCHSEPWLLFLQLPVHTESACPPTQLHLPEPSSRSPMHLSLLASRSQLP